MDDGSCERLTEVECNTLVTSTSFVGAGIQCLGDNDGDGIDDTCSDVAIPTVSEWGMVVLTLLLLVLAKVYFGRRRTWELE